MLTTIKQRTLFSCGLFLSLIYVCLKVQAETEEPSVSLRETLDQGLILNAQTKKGKVDHFYDSPVYGHVPNDLTVGMQIDVSDPVLQRKLHLNTLVIPAMGGGIAFFYQPQNQTSLGDVLKGERHAGSVKNGVVVRTIDITSFQITNKDSLQMCANLFQMWVTLTRTVYASKPPVELEPTQNLSDAEMALGKNAKEAEKLLWVIHRTTKKDIVARFFQNNNSTICLVVTIDPEQDSIEFRVDHEINK